LVSTPGHTPGHQSAECERALALDRNLVSAHASIGAAKVYRRRGPSSSAVPAGCGPAPGFDSSHRPTARRMIRRINLQPNDLLVINLSVIADRPKTCNHLVVNPATGALEIAPTHRDEAATALQGLLGGVTDSTGSDHASLGRHTEIKNRVAKLEVAGRDAHPPGIDCPVPKHRPKG
jgi:hypothetical protein